MASIFPRWLPRLVRVRRAPVANCERDCRLTAGLSARQGDMRHYPEPKSKQYSMPRRRRSCQAATRPFRTRIGTSWSGGSLRRRPRRRSRADLVPAPRWLVALGRQTTHFGRGCDSLVQNRPGRAATSTWALHKAVNKRKWVKECGSGTEGHEAKGPVMIGAVVRLLDLSESPAH